MGNAETTKPKGQFSRRHQTNCEHEEAVAIHNESSGLKSRRVSALAGLIEQKSRIETEPWTYWMIGSIDRYNEWKEKALKRIAKEMEILQLRIQ